MSGRLPVQEPPSARFILFLVEHPLHAVVVHQQDALNHFGRVMQNLYPQKGRRPAATLRQRWALGGGDCANSSEMDSAVCAFWAVQVHLPIPRNLNY